MEMWLILKIESKRIKEVKRIINRWRWFNDDDDDEDNPSLKMLTELQTAAADC